jgi:carbonic anhydrase
MYDLVQFHFHRPSEERINGKGFDMVVHLVHKDLDGRLAVVAVLLERGQAHPVMQTLWNNLPLEKTWITRRRAWPSISTSCCPRTAATTPTWVLSPHRRAARVMWMVMKQPAQVSAEQIAIFSRLYPMNARPVQSIRGRLIKESR